MSTPAQVPPPYAAPENSDRARLRSEAEKRFNDAARNAEQQNIELPPLSIQNPLGYCHALDLPDLAALDTVRKRQLLRHINRMIAVADDGERSPRRVFRTVRHALRMATVDLVESGASEAPLPPYAGRVDDAIRAGRYTDAELGVLLTSLLVTIPPTDAIQSVRDAQVEVNAQHADGGECTHNTNAGHEGEPAPQTSQTAQQTQAIPVTDSGTGSTSFDGPVPVTRVRGFKEVLADVNAKTPPLGKPLVEVLGGCEPDSRDWVLVTYRRAGGIEIEFHTVIRIAGTAAADSREVKALLDTFEMAAGKDLPARVSAHKYDVAILRVEPFRDGGDNGRVRSIIDNQVGGFAQVVRSSQSKLSLTNGGMCPVINFSPGALKSDR